ncbi:AAA family ATPase [Ornithinimicrobium sp. F0845]|uniref:helix-turn-helix transcriptional regulator n=1 Tax=Ornithinimicrobium sp. F0845 TaxID=2926412 RepID=UPI0032B1675B
MSTPRTQTPLVGRAREIDHLTAAAGIGSDPVSAAVVLGGDAGVGKTRLLSELGARAERAGWTVLVGHCLDFGDSSLPYLPFTELFGRLASAAPERSAVLAESRPAINRLQPGRRMRSGSMPGERGGSAAGGGAGSAGGAVPVGGGPGLAGRGMGPVGDEPDEGMARGELFEAVHGTLEELGDDAPLLVVVEDAHWADRSTRDMISFLFGRGFRSPVSVVVSYRSDDLHRRHPLRGAVTEWGRIPGVERLHLDALADADVRRLVRSVHEALTTGTDLPEERVREIVRRAEGNAFFAEELLDASELDRETLPADLADLLLLRLDRLDDAAQTMVRAAAVAGRRVGHDLLAAVVDQTDSELDAALRAAVEANVLVPDGSHYAFRHALLAEAVYDDLLPGERSRLHRAYVAALRSGNGLGSSAELARHARAAHDLATAVTASIEAGDDAMQVGGPDEAAEHYELALQLLEDPAVAAQVDVDRVHLTVRTGEALLESGHTERSTALLRSALARADAPAGGDDRVALLLGFARAAMMSEEDPETAVAATTEALDLVGPETRAIRATALAQHARSHIGKDRFADAVRFAQAALDLADELNLPGTAVDAATTLARLQEFLGDPEASVEALTEIVAQAREGGEPAALLRGLHQLGGAQLEVGNVTAARAAYEEATALARSTSRAWAPYGFDARVLAGITAYMLGDWVGAERTASTKGQTVPPAHRLVLAALRLMVAAGRGDPATINLVEHSRTSWSEEGFVAIMAAGAGIDAYGDDGQLDRAAEVYDEVVSIVSALWNVPRFFGQVRLAGLLLGQMGTNIASVPQADREALVARADRIRADADETVASRADAQRPMGPEGQAWHHRVQAELLRLRWLTGIDAPDEGELRAAWERAIDSFVVLGHEFEIARSRARLAAVLRAQRDTAAAHEMVALARGTATDLGALPLLAELSQLDPSAAAPAETVAGEPDLTPREREVLTLVAQGRTNGQIGKQLFISTKTVSVHVSNILAKLGATGRTEAAALARARGLL